ncbi:hypothetical protein DL89DRAFT_132497 [Linderina pennispora]|uniref:Uncharacterized protein n=1 Tax=Linderina pennispora TaxID=61395 RepID=A0A1Y1VVS7_9FUNG|nr:uncharacterized protein DL89DRAFT_132497 [Linderina pennispora]ORX65125.1 hypothetical protein DL89DRAFT_132497 [Linderina pennispora]
MDGRQGLCSYICDHAPRTPLPLSTATGGGHTGCAGGKGKVGRKSACIALVTRGIAVFSSTASPTNFARRFSANRPKRLQAAVEPRSFGQPVEVGVRGRGAVTDRCLVCRALSIAFRPMSFAHFCPDLGAHTQTHLAVTRHSTSLAGPSPPARTLAHVQAYTAAQAVSAYLVAKSITRP